MICRGNDAKVTCWVTLIKMFLDIETMLVLLFGNNIVFIYRVGCAAVVDLDSVYPGCRRRITLDQRPAVLGNQ